MIDLRDYFDRVLVMNLDIRPDRWDEFQNRADMAGITGFERYRAIEGEKCPHPHWWRCGNGAWGCLMSHLRVCQDALQDGLSSYLVFEDDAVFTHDFSKRLPEIMGALKTVDWDQLYLGGQHLQRETSPPWPFRDQIVRSRNVNRTHSFAVNKRFMVKFSQHIMHFPDYMTSYRTWEETDAEGKSFQKEFMNHIDHQLGELHNKREHLILAANPWLCGQGASSSSVNGQMVEEQWWNESLGWYE